MNRGRSCAAFVMFAVCLGCSRGPSSEQVIFSNLLDSLDGVLTKTALSFDSSISHDGRGSIRVDATEPTTVRIAEVQPQDVESAILIYRAHLRTENLSGEAYLEMWCSFAGKGEFFSRALQAPLSGTTDWVSQETPFFLEKDQRPQTVKLNVAVAGKGTVWVDDVVLAVAR